MGLCIILFKKCLYRDSISTLEIATSKPVAQLIYRIIFTNEVERFVSCRRSPRGNPLFNVSAVLPVAILSHPGAPCVESVISNSNVTGPAKLL